MALCFQRLTRPRDEKRESLGRKWVAFDLSQLFETVIISCSDQQVFTGGAYALSLRFWKGCTITAYHYNVIAKMLLLTCATHLMSVAIVRHYWRYPLLAFVRVVVITGVFIVTGLLLGNQNATRAAFPTSVPTSTKANSLIMMRAACVFSGRRKPVYPDVDRLVQRRKERRTGLVIC